MKKIRINELARQLEIPSHEILEMLPELGVSEKKTHSSSIDDDVADMIRRRVSGNGTSAERFPMTTLESHADETVEEHPFEAAEPEAPEGEPSPAPQMEQAAPVVETVRPAPEPVAAAPGAPVEPTPSAEEPSRMKPMPIRPPLSGGGAPIAPPLRSTVVHAKPVPTAPSTPRPGQILWSPAAAATRAATDGSTTRNAFDPDAQRDAGHAAAGAFHSTARRAACAAGFPASARPTGAAC